MITPFLHAMMWCFRHEFLIALAVCEEGAEWQIDTLAQAETIGGCIAMYKTYVWVSIAVVVLSLAASGCSQASTPAPTYTALPTYTPYPTLEPAPTYTFERT